jgi:hypothetical protein
MSYALRSFSILASIALGTLPAGAQSVISTRSGVIHFFEGNVYLGDQRLEPHLGRFQSIPQDAELRTAEGRAEVLLTPGVFLRMGEMSAIRLVANALADTQVEFESGSAIVDSAEPNADTSVTLLYKNWRVHILQGGVYRIESNPPRLSVRQGEAEVSAAAVGHPVSVRSGMSLPFAGVLVPESSIDQPRDMLSDWSHGRSESVSADNAIAAQIDEDPSTRTAGLDSFTYFPPIGVSTLGLSPYGLGPASPYSSYLPYQLGFNSIYLPGYTYRPLLLGLGGLGIRPYVPSSTPRRIGVSPGLGTMSPIPRVPVLGLSPRSPVPAAAPRPVIIRPAAPAPVRGGVRR